jgi:predicted lipase
MATPLGSLLTNLMQQAPSWHFTIFSSWESIMGSLSTKVTVERINNNVITLGVYDSCWLQELYHLSPLLKNRINQALDQPHIKELRFKQINAQQRKKYHAKKDNPVAAVATLPLTKEEEKVVQTVDDPELQKLLLQFRTRCQGSFIGEKM